MNKNYIIIILSIIIILLICFNFSFDNSHNYTVKSIEYKVSDNGKGFLYTENIIVQVPNIYQEDQPYLVEFNDSGTPDYYGDDKLVWIYTLK